MENSKYAGTERTNRFYKVGAGPWGRSVYQQFESS